jgi:hypothetical protein
MAPAPFVFNGPFPNATENPPFAPIQMYHLGLWFGSRDAARAAGCPDTVTLPRYGFLLVTLIGEKAKFPEVCHGMRHELTPCSTALTIWDVTREYTSCFSVEWDSDIEVALNFGV